MKLSKRNRVGRPALYRPEYAELARRCCLAFGSTDEELANFFGVSAWLVGQWRAEYPEFADACKEGKGHADSNVVQKLYHRAIGFTEEVEEVYRENGKTIRVKVKKYFPPDTTACIFWLKNRRPDQWRDRLGGVLGALPPSLDIGAFSDHQLDIFIARLQTNVHRAPEATTISQSPKGNSDE
jgi:hypothetical protein